MVETLQELLRRANIPETDWDVVLIGDGSGTGWKDYAGWAAVLIDKETRGRKLVYGGMNQGSINLAELMPYLQAMTWYHANGGGDALKRRGFLRVHVITDSQTVAMHGVETARLNEALPKTQQGLWAAFREMQRMGYVFHWHWAPRCSADLNTLADLVAGLARREIKNIDVSGFHNSFAQRAAEAVQAVCFFDPETQAPISPYHVNPDAGISQTQ